MNHIKNYSIRIAEQLYQRINRHIQLLKCLNKNQKKQDWLEDAILKKLHKKTQDLPETFSSKSLGFKINSQIDVEVDKQVKVMKKTRGNFSKKQWILEAIQEKLDLEEKDIENKSEELLKNMLKKTSSVSEIS